MSKPIVNCHTHVFTLKHLPSGFLPKPLMWALERRAVKKPLGGLAKGFAFVWPGISPATIARVMKLVRIMRENPEEGVGGQERLLRRLADFYPPDTKFVLLAMDMEFMGAGRPEESLEQQLDGLAEIKRKDRWRGRLLPFVAADPRRKEHLDLVKKYIEEHGFSGVKLYPPLGYWACDKRFMKKGGLYEYCEREGVPIMTHASVPEPVVFRGKPDEEAMKHPFGDPMPRDAFSSNKRHAKVLANPDEFRPVFEKYPGLKVCFGHFGGHSQWNEYLARPWRSGDAEKQMGVDGNWVYKILTLMREFASAYADVSYTWAYPRFTPLLKLLLADDKISSRVLFGSDFYMVEMDVSEREASIQFRYDLGESGYTRIARENPESYLFAGKESS